MSRSAWSYRRIYCETEASAWSFELQKLLRCLWKNIRALPRMRDLESSLSSKRRHLLVIMESQEAVLDVDSGGVAGSCSVQRSHRTIFRLVSTVGSADWRWPTTRNLYSAGDRRSHLSRLSPAQCHQKWHPPSSGTPQSSRKSRRVRLRGLLS